MKKLRSIYFVTGNSGKLKEAETILGFSLKNKALELDEIQDLDIEKIVTQKAIDAYEQIKKPLIVDDGGIYFDAWNGFPGPLVKYLDKAGGVDLVLKMLRHESNRDIIMRSAVAYHNGTDVEVFIGEINARIAKKPRGNNGWSWDTIFLPKPYKNTLAEMTDEEKSKVSHRKKAFEKLKKYIEKTASL